MTLNAVPVELAIELVVPAEKVPVTVSSDTPVVGLFVLVMVVGCRSIVALVTSTAGPPVAS